MGAPEFLPCSCRDEALKGSWLRQHTCTPLSFWRPRVQGHWRRAGVRAGRALGGSLSAPPPAAVAAELLGRWPHPSLLSGCHIPPLLFRGLRSTRLPLIGTLVTTCRTSRIISPSQGPESDHTCKVLLVEKVFLGSWL